MANSKTFPRDTRLSSLVRLRRATLWLLTILCAMFLTAIGWHLYVEYEDGLENGMRNAHSVAQAAKSHVERTFSEINKVLYGIADVYRSELAAGQVDEKHLHDVMATKLGYMPYLAGILILTPDGTPVASARAYPVAQYAGLFENLPLRPQDNRHDRYLGTMVHGVRDLEGQWILPSGIRVRDGEGRIVAIVVGVLYPESFSTFFKTLEIGNKGRVILWTAAEQMVSTTAVETTPVGGFNPGVERRAVDLADRSTTNDPRVIVNDDAADGYRRLITNLLIDDLPLMVSTRISSEDYLAGWRQTRDRFVFASLFILGATVAFILIILRQIAQSSANEQALQLAKAAAEEANAAKSRFLAHMSHEFRTPLNAIMGFADIIKSKVMGDNIAPIYANYAEHIHRSGEHLLNIVNDILDMAKVESGTQSIQCTPVDIAGTVARSKSFVDALTGQHSITLRSEIPPQLPRLTSDERFLRQVLINLLSNAVKFSHAGTAVVISADIIEGNLEIRVVDSGPGIDPVVLKRIGEPFLQGNPALTRTGQGTGLCLSICKHYMNLLGGELILRSEVGVGTTAILRFPGMLMVSDAA